MALRKPLVMVGTSVRELPAGDVLDPAAVPGGGSAWGDITGKPQLLSSDGWATMVIPARWSTVTAIGTTLETQAGTVEHPLLSNAGLRAGTPRWSLTGNGAADGGVGQFTGNQLAMVSASGSAAGGFAYRCLFSVTSARANQRGFVGLMSYMTNTANAEPYNGPDNIGVAFDTAADANYQMVCHPDYGVLTKQDAGAGFAIGNANAVLEVVLKNAPGSGIVTWKLRDLNSGANAAGAFTANLPGPAKRLGHKHFMNNNGNVGAVSMELMPIYLGSYIPD